MHDDQDFDAIVTSTRVRRALDVKDVPLAVVILEDYMHARAGALPSLRLVLRLAMLYQLFERYHDELKLLQDFLTACPGTSQRARLDAKISKAEALLFAQKGSSTIPISIQLARPRRKSVVEKRLDTFVRRRKVPPARPLVRDTPNAAE